MGHNKCLAVLHTGAFKRASQGGLHASSYYGAALAAGAALAVGAHPDAQAQTITLDGAVQFNDDHAFTKALVRFQDLVKQYYGKPIEFVLHKNSALGLEKQYSEYMAQGRTVDYGIVSPAHMSAFSKAAPFINAPFLFRDIDHWNSVLNQDILKPVAEGVEQRAWSRCASSRVPPTWRSSELGPVPGAACDGRARRLRARAGSSAASVGK